MDQRVFDLAYIFLKEGGLTGPSLKDHSLELGALLQRTIEDYINTDLYKCCPPYVTQNPKHKAGTNAQR